MLNNYHVQAGAEAIQAAHQARKTSEWNASAISRLAALGNAAAMPAQTQGFFDFKTGTDTTGRANNGIKVP